MNVSDRGRRSYGRHLAFVIACLVVPYAGIYAEILFLSGIDELGGFEDPYIPLVRLGMIAVPTLGVAAVIWLLSNRWYRRRTAVISTIGVSAISFLVYAMVALLFTSPIG